MPLVGSAVDAPTPPAGASAAHPAPLAPVAAVAAAADGHRTEAEDYDAATLVGIVMSLVMGSLYVAARLTVGVDWRAALVTVGTSLLLVALPGLPPRVRRSPASPDAPRPLAFHVWGTLLALVLVCGAAVLSSRAGVALGVPLAAVGGVCAAAVALRWLARRSLPVLLGFLLPAGLLATWAGALAWGTHEYMHPLAVERLLAGFRLHSDTLFHAAVANVWQSYGIPANGVDGVQYLAYHYGSHWLISRLGELAGVAPLQAYQLSYPVVLLPWLFTSLLRFALDLRPLLAARAAWATTTRAPLFWLILLAVSIGLVPVEWVEEINSSYQKPVLSQSYTLGLTLGLLVGSTMVWLRVHDAPPRRSAGSLLVLWVVLPALTTSLGFAKISLLGLAVGVQLFLLVRLSLWRSPRHLVALALVLAGAVGSHLLTNPAHSSGMGAFLSIGAQAYQLLWIAKNYYLPVHLFWTLLYVVLRLHGERVRTWGDLRRRVAERRLLDVEVLTVVAVLGLGPLVMLETGGNGYYFSDVQRWLAAALLIGRFGLVDQRWRERWSARRERGVHPAAAVVGGALALSAATALLLNTALPGLRVVRLAGAVGQAAESAAPRDEAVAFLLELGRRPAAERATALLYVPRSVRAYWDRPEWPCWGIPFLAPALSGMALLDGLPTAPCSQAGYGYAAYGALERPADRPDLDAPAMCRAVVERGFLRVVVAASGPDGRLLARDVACGPDRRPPGGSPAAGPVGS